MRHRISGRQLSRNTNERKRLLEGLTREVILHGTITTTLAKAKSVRPFIERLVTHAKKKETGSGIYEVRKRIRDHNVYQKFSATVAALGDRNSGYTRIVRLGPRKSDGAEMVRFGFVAQAVPSELPPAKPTRSVKEEKASKTRKSKAKTDTSKLRRKTSTTKTKTSARRSRRKKA